MAIKGPSLQVSHQITVQVPMILKLTALMKHYQALPR